MLSGLKSREVRQWLRERITLEQAEERYTRFDEGCHGVGFPTDFLANFRKDVAAEMQPNDELWLYDSGPESWAHKHGQRGLALVRNGEVVKVMLEAHN